ncbi:hypothetical protein MRS44_014170 [Fusarium solani]|uniref:uncharacterized protein n=1 Tax=Fusarium solani TaxID=169388 RepID=UPI0032C498C7|nr:hypothetical protein MRS44_014170 [Fusarium solani]
MRPSSVTAVLGGIFHSISAAGFVKGGEFTHVSWCITYLSTYLAPVSTNTAGPVLVETSTARLSPSLVPSSSGNPWPAASSTRGLQGPNSRDSSLSPTPSISTNTLLPSDAGTYSLSSTATSGPDAADGNLIFAITPSTDSSKRDLSKRARGGFVGGENAVNPNTCTDASTFSLVSGQLFHNGLPIYYSGEAYKSFSGQGTPPGGSITTTFQNAQGLLQFVNPSLPNGQAGFCQDSVTGEVYITFSRGPADCAPVSLTIYSVEQCLNGEIDDRVPPSSTNASTGSSRGVETSGSSVSTGNGGSIDASNLPTLVSQDYVASTERLPTSSDSTLVLQDTWPTVSRTPSPAYSSSTETSTEEKTPTSSGDDLSFTDTPPKTSTLAEYSSIDTSPVESASATESEATELSIPEPPSISTNSFLDTSTPTDPSSSTKTLPMTDTAPTEPTDWPFVPMTSFPVADFTTQSYEEEPTPIFSDDDFLNSHRDDSKEITLPFPVTMYSSSNNIIYVSVNGVISLGDGSGATDHGEFPSDYLADKSIAIYWTRNSIIPGSGQGVTYRVLGEGPGRLAIFDFKVHPDSNTANDEPDHYKVTFMEHEPRFCSISYIHTNGKGGDATVGHQDYSNRLHRQYSYNEPGAIPDMTWLYMSLKRDGIFESGPEGQ